MDASGIVIGIAVGGGTAILGVGAGYVTRLMDWRREDRLREASEGREDRLRFHQERMASTADLIAASQTAHRFWDQARAIDKAGLYPDEAQEARVAFRSAFMVRDQAIARMRIVYDEPMPQLLTELVRSFMPSLEAPPDESGPERQRFIRAMSAIQNEARRQLGRPSGVQAGT